MALVPIVPTETFFFMPSTIFFLFLLKNICCGAHHKCLSGKNKKNIYLDTPLFKGYPRRPKYWDIQA